MLAFRNASRLGVDLVEFDVHPSQDGRLVVHHDPLLDRMTNGSGRLHCQSFRELSQLTIKGTENGRIPLLSEVIEVFQSTPISLRIEIKADADFNRYPGVEAKLASEIEASGMIERTVVTSFYIDALVCFREIAKPHNLIWLVKKSVYAQIGGLQPVLEIVKSRNIKEIALHQLLIGPREVAAAMASGIRLGAYAVNDEDAICTMLKLGVTTFTSDRPDIALKLRENIQGQC